ncbi:MAG TPA: UDP-2,3-diacylglucosamine diphosphatase, partial [Burkholderiaceae bacterium]|nr:UDP-2,3-diacylglucosamine diphosphatase [Burkholderiaceae bacterium]
QPTTVALFVSDLHLQAAMPRTAEAFFGFLHALALHTRQLYLLGDIFEYWAGDDDANPFNQRVIDEIRTVSDRGVEIFWISGNRDFLVGEKFAAACGIKLLGDPFVTTIAGEKVVLTHGDAMCTDDLAYIAFRAQVRQPAWQSEFLARPLEQRKAIIAGLRQGSREAQKEKTDAIMDVNQGAVHALFDSTGTATMIHGHTHRPARHVDVQDGVERYRYVLPDWDCDIESKRESKRGGWISIAPNGEIARIGLDGLALP